jgi:hypothetical protein
MTRDQFISNMMGKSWSPNDPADILELQQFVLGAAWWDEFCLFAFNKDEHRLYCPVSWMSHFIAWLFSDASRFADLVAEFRGWKDG